MALTSPQVDASRVAPGLYVGSRPQPGLYRWLGVIVLCAKEFQPPSYMYPGVMVVHVPLDDDPTRAMRPDEIALAVSTARTLARCLQAHQRVLATCRMGLNRSALIASLTMQMAYDMSPDETIKRIRSVRGPFALRNPGFRWLIRQLAVEP